VGSGQSAVGSNFIERDKKYEANKNINRTQLLPTAHCPLPTAACRLPTAMIQDIPYRNIPHQSALFLKYLECAPDALSFYQQSPTIKNLVQLAQDGLAGTAFPRKEIASILRRQNTLFGADDSVMQHIDELEKPGSVAIVTGQQVGLFTGPIYTIYKALTAVKIAEKLRKRGIRAVPVFWMETEDHDFQEASLRTVLDSPKTAQIVDFGKVLFNETGISMHSVGSVRFPQNITKATEEYLQYLPTTQHLQVKTLLESTYAPDTTFALAFARLLLQILQGFGLVCFDPSDSAAKQLVSPIFQKALQHADVVRSALRQRNQEILAAGFHTQVQVLENSTIVFLSENGKRRNLEQHEAGFRLKNSEHEFTHDKLLKYVQQSPEKFSPSVLLRPIIQDHLFPTIAYVGGAAEVSYFAQIETLYSLFQRPMPVIWPRNGFTLIEPAIAEEMKRLQIGMQDCFLEKPVLMEKILHQFGYSRTMGKLDHLHKQLDQELTEIRPTLEALEKRLPLMLDKSQQKILHNVRYLKSRVLRQETLHHTAIADSMDAILNHCRPNGHLQERELTVLHFLAGYGMPLLNALYSATEIDSFLHRVLWLEHT
jgi:bacillithiol synthase